MNQRHTSHPAGLTACTAGHNARHFCDTAEGLKLMASTQGDSR